MKKLFLSLALFVAMGATAQTAEYGQRVRELIRMGATVTSPAQVKEMLKQSLSTVLPADEVNTIFDTLLGEYFESGEILDDIAAAYTPYLYKTFTPEAMDSILSLYRSAEGQKVLAMSARASEGAGAALQKLLPAIVQVAQGKDAPKVERTACPEAYRKAFDEYFRLTQTATMEKMEAQLKAVPGSERLLAYMREALPEFVLATVYPALTEDDLTTAVRFFSNPLLHRYANSAASIPEADLAPFMQKIQQKMEAAMK